MNPNSANMFAVYMLTIPLFVGIFTGFSIFLMDWFKNNSRLVPGYEKDENSKP